MTKCFKVARCFSVMLIMLCISTSNICASDYSDSDSSDDDSDYGTVVRLENIYPMAQINRSGNQGRQYKSNSRDYSTNRVKQIKSNEIGYPHNNVIINPKLKHAPVLGGMPTTTADTETQLIAKNALIHSNGLALLLGECAIAPLLAYYSYETTPIAHASAAMNILFTILAGLKTLSYFSDLSMTECEVIPYALTTALCGASSFYGWSYYINHTPNDRIMNFYCALSSCFLGSVYVLALAYIKRENAARALAAPTVSGAV